MNSFLKTRIHSPHLPAARLMTVAAILSLAACAVAPGMSVNEHTMPPVTAITAAVIATEQPSADASYASLLATFASTGDGYRLGPGDVLAIAVMDHPELLPQDAPNNRAAGDLPAGYVVDASGAIAYPLVGAVPVAEQTVADVRRALTEKLGKYIRAPQVSVRVAGFRSQRIYVDGAVSQTGMQSITDVPMTLATALGGAGGLKPEGDASHITLTRAGHTYAVSLPALARAGHGPEDIHLHDQDRVRIGERNDFPVFVAGEVGQAKPVPMRDGELSLGQALALAGSLSQTGSDPRGVYVVRLKDGDTEPKVYRLDATSPVGLALASRFPLQANDLVYVQTAGLMRWNRVMNLLLSSTLSLYNTQHAAAGM